MNLSADREALLRRLAEELAALEWSKEETQVIRRAIEEYENAMLKQQLEHDSQRESNWRSLANQVVGEEC